MANFMEDQEKKLYPLKFVPIVAQNDWGTETYCLADLGAPDSVAIGGWLDEDSLGDIMETYMDRVLGENPYYFYGRQFPLTIKKIETKADMPVFVCPDDELASVRYDALGNAKFWYIVSAKDDAVVYLGFSRNVMPEEVYAASGDGSLRSLMNVKKVKKGDFFEIDPGIVHGASAGLEIIEISEASPLNLDLTDASDLVEALDFINYDKGCHLDCHCEDGDCHCHEDGHECHCHEDKIATHLAEREEFVVTKVKLSDPLHIYMEQFGSFLVYVVAEGEASVQVPVDGGMESYVVSKGECLLIPAECPDFFLVPRDRETVLLECGPGEHEEHDSYLDNPEDHHHHHDHDCCEDGHCHHHHDAE